MRMKSLSAALAAAGMLIAGSAGAFSLAPNFMKPEPKTVAIASTPTTPADQPPAVKGLSSDQLVPDYRAIVKQEGPAVVGVAVAGMHKLSAQEQGLPPGVENDPFFRFFRGMPGMQPHSSRSVPFKGLGSGFIISPDGLILTNAHVVRDAKEVTVTLSDRREFPAKVLGTDTTTDIAVLKIDAKNLPVVRIGDASKLEVGDPVLAIGQPYGFTETATQGIVSAKGRSLPGDAVVPFIQTDAAVNPGNSGGPLFDGSGAVVGINAQIYSQSGGFQGLSFAIPINVALKVKDQIVATGHAEHARLGVTVQDLNQSLADSFGLKLPDGALVASVAPKSAAAAAGLKPGDVITSVEGNKIVRSGELSNLIGMSKPGDEVKLQVWRDHQQKEIDAKLGNAEEPSTQVASANGSAQGGQLGLELRPLTPQERQATHIDHGLVVQDAEGAAARAGIQEGDVLLAINGKSLDSVQQLRNVLKEKPKTIALLVQRGDETIFVPVQLG